MRLEKKLVVNENRGLSLFVINKAVYNFEYLYSLNARHNRWLGAWEKRQTRKIF